MILGPGSKSNKSVEIFISYKWRDESEEVCDELEKILTNYGFKVLRDKNELKHNALISKFIQQLSKGKFVIIIVSEAYLKSRYCMEELLLLYKRPDFLEHIFPIILPNAKIYEPESIVGYIKYWDEKINSLQNKIKILDALVKIQQLTKDLDLFVDIRSNFDKIVGFLRDINIFEVEKNDYQKIIQSIQHQLSSPTLKSNSEGKDFSINLPVKSSSEQTLTNKEASVGLSFLTEKLEQSVVSKESLTQMYELQGKIFNPILEKFKLKLGKDIQMKADFIQLLFERIISYDKLTDLDKEYINHIKTTGHFLWYEKSILISALTIGCLNKFDDKKLDLLIDFSIKGEDKIWQPAFVGVILSLLKHSNKISSHPYLQRSLNRIGESSELQQSLTIIENILRRKTYSPQSNLSDDQRLDQIVEFMFNEVMPDESIDLLELKETDLLDIENASNLKESEPFDPIHRIVQFVDVKKLRLSMDEGLHSLTFLDFFKDYFDIKKCIASNELNPLMLPYKKAKISAFDWFMPFFKENELTRDFIAELPETIGDAQLFLEWLERSPFMNNVDKYFVLLHHEKMDPFFFEMLQRIMDKEEEYISRLLTNEPDFIQFNSIISELYRFIKFFKNKDRKDVFDSHVHLANENILSFISDNLTIQKLKGFAFNDQNDFENANNKLSEYHELVGNDLSVIDQLISIKKKLSKWEDMIELYRDKIRLFPKKKDRQIVIDSFYGIFNIQNNQKQYDDALQTLLQMEKLFALRESESEKMGKIILLKGLVYVRNNELQRGMLFYFKAFHILKKHCNADFRAVQFNMLSNIHKSRNEDGTYDDFNESVEYYLKTDPEINDLLKSFQYLINMFYDFKVEMLNESIIGNDKLMKIYEAVLPTIKSVNDKDPGKYNFISVPLKFDDYIFSTLRANILDSIDEHQGERNFIKELKAGIFDELFSLLDFDFFKQLSFRADGILDVTKEGIDTNFETARKTWIYVFSKVILS